MSLNNINSMNNDNKLKMCVQKDFYNTMLLNAIDADHVPISYFTTKERSIWLFNMNDLG